MKTQRTTWTCDLCGKRLPCQPGILSLRGNPILVEEINWDVCDKCFTRAMETLAHFKWTIEKEVSVDAYAENNDDPELQRLMEDEKECKQ